MKSKTILQYILSCAIITIFTVITFIIVQKIKQPLNSNQVQESIISKYPDYENFIKMNNFLIAENFFTNGSVSKGKSLNKKYQLNDVNSIGDTYLYIEASINNTPLRSAFEEDIYLKINNIGGHVIIDKNSLPTISKDGISVYLFPLNSISFKANINTKPSEYKYNFNFLNLINNSGKFNIVAHINSERNNKKFIKIAIGYDCQKDKLCSIKESKQIDGINSTREEILNIVTQIKNMLDEITREITELNLCR